MVFVASLPGAAVLLADWVRRTPSAALLERPLPLGLGVLARRHGAPDV
jgi:hypothetical protein